MNANYINRKELAVVKLGSSSVSDPENGMNEERLHHSAEQISDLMKDFEVLLVCSGAINTGKAARRGGTALDRDQDYAAIGSARSFIAVHDAFKEFDIETAQIMVTNHEMDSVEGQNYEESLLSLSSQGILPVINGNDSLSKVGVEEYKIDTDNDRLAGHTAELTMARYLILLTDEAGLLDRKEVVREVDVSDRQQRSYAIGLTPYTVEPGKGRGGMRSKVTVAINGAQQGADAYIGSAGANYREILAGESGTHFFDPQSPWQ